MENCSKFTFLTRFHLSEERKESVLVKLFAIINKFCKSFIFEFLIRWSKVNIISPNVEKRIGPYRTL